MNNKTIYLKEPVGNTTNVFMTKDEIQKLINDFRKTAVLSSIQEYSRWKEEKNAHPKSDYVSLRKWLNQKGTNVAYKTNTTAVKETGVDEVSQETLDNLPF